MPRFAWWVMVAGIAAGLAALASGASASQFKRIQDISVSCTDGLTCDVSTYNAQSELYTVIFRRTAQRDAPVRLVLGVRETLSGDSDVGFSIDERPVLTIPVSELSYRAAVYEYIYDGGPEIAALMAAAAAGQELRVTFRSRGIDTVSTFSLNGFIAGLIFMDEVQRRVGREDALQVGVVTGAQGEAAVRDIRALSDVPFQIRAAFADRDGAVCRGLSEDRFAAIGGFEASSGDDSWLIGLPCGEGGAYNQPYAFWERTGSNFRRVPLPVMTGDGPSTDDLAWNISWDQERQELTGFFKGRGLGDCGEFNRWSWKETGTGHVFVLTGARAKGDCDGEPGGPETWPSIWPPAG